MKRFIILLAILVPFGGMAAILRSMTIEPDRQAQFEQVPLDFADWHGREIPILGANATSLKATASLLREYQDSKGNFTDLFIAYFQDQKYGSQIHSPRHCLPGGGWVVSNLTRVPFRYGNRTITVNRMTITKREYTEQMYYWFVTRSGELTSEYSLKFDLVKNSLLLSPTDAALIRVTLPCSNQSQSECQQKAEKFVELLVPDIDRALPFESVR